MSTLVLVPHLNGIENECEVGLKGLESAGLQVWRRPGSSAIDYVRNEMVSVAMHQGFKTIFFIDADTGFEVSDVLKLITRPEPVVTGVCSKKGVRELASVFGDGIKEVVFGKDAPESYPLRYAGTGFMRIHTSVLYQMIVRLKLPLCNTYWGKGIWPFFQPMIADYGASGLHYLTEDWAFSYRLWQIGVIPLADTRIRLYHWGRYGYGWEDAPIQRHESFIYKLGS